MPRGVFSTDFEDNRILSHRRGWDSEDGNGRGFLNSLDQNLPRRIFSRESRNIGICCGEVFSTDFEDDRICKIFYH